MDSVGSTDDIPFDDVELNTVDSHTILFQTKDRFKINSQYVSENELPWDAGVQKITKRTKKK